MSKYRKSRINDAVAQELAVALREARDPGLTDNFVSITRAEVSPDLKIARVWYSVMGDKEQAAGGLARATGMLRRHLAISLNLRITPELTFIADNSIEHGAHIARLLEEVLPEATSSTEEEER